MIFLNVKEDYALLINENMHMLFRFVLFQSMLCLKNVHLWLAIVFTYTARLQQFLAKMLPRK